MGSDKTVEFTELELDLLQELMNISFGGAAADLAEVIDIFIALESPEVVCLKAGAIISEMKETIPDFDTCSIVEQHYHGDISGVAVLIFPEGADRELLNVFQTQSNRNKKQDTLLELEKEIIMEMGNILIGACLGNLFKTLNSQITYLPPWTNTGGVFRNIFLSETIDEDDTAITMSTVFNFEDRNITGNLFIINNNSSIRKIQDALADYWKQQNVL